MEKSKHGMTTAQAIEKKESGHIIERHLADRICGVVVKGTGKVDVTKNEDNYSVKRGKKVQWALLSQDSIVNEFQKNGISTDELINYFDFLPEKDTFLQNRSKFRKNINAEPLSKVFSENVSKILNIVITKNGQVNKLSFYDDRTESDGLGTGKFFIFDAKESIDVIVGMVKNVYFTPGGKVVIKSDLQLFEIELRKGTNHKKLLFHSHTRRILDILKSKIDFTEV
jgi:hypothetical protein